MRKVIIPEMRGGTGEVTIEHILEGAELKGNCGMYAKVTINPGSSLGYHTHENESETYFVLSGTGEYNDNGTVRTVKVGDTTITPNGCGHAMKTLGDEPLVFMALIIKD